MIISGSGITTFTAKIKRGFRPDTQLAIRWNQADDGNYYAIDRGAASDIYEANIELYGYKEDIDRFVLEIENNRKATTGTPNQIFLGNISQTEHIFGEDVAYVGGINATILDMSQVRQGSLNGFGLSVKLRALSVTYSVSPSLPDLKYLSIGYIADNEPTIKKYDTYTGAYTYIDRRSDAGEFEGTLILTRAEMAGIRRYIATERGNDITIPAVNGVTYPFGRRRGITFPATCKILDYEDLGLWGVKYNRIKLRLAEVVT